MLPRRSAPVVLGLVVTSLVTMLTGTQLVTQATRPSFQRTRPVELTLGSLGPVRADPPAPAVSSGPASGDPARSTEAGTPPARGDTGPSPGREGTAVRMPRPGGDRDAPVETRAAADRPAAPGGARGGAAEAPEEVMRTLIGHRGLPCAQRARLRFGRLQGRSPGSCRPSGRDPPAPARDPPAPAHEPDRESPSRDPPASAREPDPESPPRDPDPESPPREPDPESPPRERLPRPGIPASGLEDEPLQARSLPEQSPPRTVTPPRAVGPPRGSSRLRRPAAKLAAGGRGGPCHHGRPPTRARAPR